LKWRLLSLFLSPFRCHSSSKKQRNPLMKKILGLQAPMELASIQTKEIILLYTIKIHQSLQQVYWNVLQKLNQNRPLIGTIDTRRWNPKYIEHRMRNNYLYLGIFLTIQPDNLKYHVCRITCYPKVSLIQRWTNPQLQSEKYSLVGVWKPERFFLSQYFVTGFPLLNESLTSLHLNKCDKMSIVIWTFTPHKNEA